MLKLLLSQEKYAIIDDDDFERIGKYKWHFHRKPSDPSGYARRWTKANGKRKCLYMHQEILGVTGKVDHINHDTIDNRKQNLRAASAFQNQHNRTVSRANKSTGFKGVGYIRDRNGVLKYCIARISINKVRLYLGVFSSPEEAATAYDAAAIKHHGEFACLNFPANR